MKLENNLLSGFLQSSTQYAKHSALCIGNETITYDEFSKQIAKLANCINKHQNTPKRIGVLAYRSKTAYLGVMASLFVGASYIPLNKNFPLERTASMCNQADLDVIIVAGDSIHYLQLLLPLLNKKPLLVFPDSKNIAYETPTTILTADDIQTCSDQLPSIKNEDSIAYILFTSGSTGQPKGVLISHQSALHFIKHNQKKYQITANDRLSQTFDQTFDLSVFDMFMAWSHGACLCVMQPIDLLAPTHFINQQKITVWFSVPSVINLARKKQLLKAESLPTLRLSLFCGEPLTVEAAASWQQAATNSIIDNLYGPTEFTIACTTYRYSAETLQEAENGIVPIGKPYDGLDILIVDKDLRLVSAQAEGELCVAGPQLFKGYLNNEEKTKEATFYYANKYFYRTGDSVRLSEKGNLLYLGRIDHQIKLNGYRLELGEIEHHLRQYNNVIDAVAIGWPEESGRYTGIAAFITGTIAELESVTHYLRTKLPNYMIPHIITKVNSIPLNSNGKIDRKSLQKSLDNTRENNHE